MAKYVTITIRRDSKLNWENCNPRLALGELGIDMTTHRLKAGNGIDKWKQLPYINGDLYSQLDNLLESILVNKRDADNKIKDLNTKVKNLEGRQDDLENDFEQETSSINTRLDVILGSATEDYEILDARVDAEGNVHPNLGHNIRSLHNLILKIKEQIKEETDSAVETERRIRVSQDDGLQNQIDLLAQSIELFVLDYVEVLRRIRQVEGSDGNATRAENEEFEEMLNEVYP